MKKYSKEWYMESAKIEGDAEIGASSFPASSCSPSINPKLAAEIRTEQNHGRQKYGNGPDDFAHDDSHAPEDWHEYIADHNTRAELSTPMERRQHLVKVAGLAISAIESFDRKTENTPDQERG